MRGVIKLDRITIFRDGFRKQTGTFILTFQSQTLPKYIRVGYYRVAVSQFIPNPIKCYKCQKFGHTKFNCSKNEVCNKCVQEDHTDSQECKNESTCVVKEIIQQIIGHVQNGNKRKKYR